MSHSHYRSSDPYYAFELAAASWKLVTQVAQVCPGQDVLITSDSESDRRVVDATAAAAYLAGAHPIVVHYASNSSPCMDPPNPVAASLKVAHVWIEYAATYILYSQAWQSAIDGCCHHICLPGMDVDMMVRTVGEVDCTLVEDLGKRLHQLSQHGKSVRITSPAGTDISVRVNPELDPFDKPPDRSKGYSQMLVGQAGFNTFPETFEGTLVLDGTVWPPKALGALGRSIKLSIEKGNISHIEGGYEANLFRSWLESFNHPAMMMLDHVCFGFNPGVTRLSGRILEDERLFGCVEFGIGRVRAGAPSHCDGVILAPSVWVDDIKIEKNGIYLDPAVVSICRTMKVLGY